MKKLLISIFLIIFFSGALMSAEEIDQIILKVKNKFAPDKRTAIFEISSSLDDSILTLIGEVSDSTFRNALVEEISKSCYCKIVDNVIVLPEKKLLNKYFGLIINSVANLRSKPDHPYELVTQAILGTPVKILKEDEGWYLVQTPDDYLGWVDDDAIEAMTREEFNEWSKSKLLLFTDLFGVVSKNPSNKSEVVSDIVFGSILKYVLDSGEFYKVQFPDGREGFVSKNKVVNFDVWINSQNYDKERIIESAKKFIGFPYLWGGTSVKGMDCSGFTKTVYFMNGLILSRDASQQVNLGEEISLENNFSSLQPGDLLFFGRKKSNGNNERITHVGIYIGNLEYIHSSGRVRINSLDSTKSNYNSYRYNSLVKAKRILGNPQIFEPLKIQNNKYYKQQ